jgi:hypothetical protein
MELSTWMDVGMKERVVNRGNKVNSNANAIKEGMRVYRTQTIGCPWMSRVVSGKPQNETAKRV